MDYRLTAKGEALLPVLVALRQWGHAWGDTPGCGPVLVDRDRKPLREMKVQAHDGRPVQFGELSWFEPGPEEDAAASAMDRPEPHKVRAAHDHS